MLSRLEGQSFKMFILKQWHWGSVTAKLKTSLTEKCMYLVEHFVLTMLVSRMNMCKKESIQAGYGDSNYWRSISKTVVASGNLILHSTLACLSVMCQQEQTLL